MGQFREVSFQDYLEAKYAVDDDSLNRKVFQAFAGDLSSYDSPRILDIGTGTGSMIRRVLLSDLVRLSGKVEWIGLDIEKKNLKSAAAFIPRDIKANGWKTEIGHHHILAERDGCNLSIDLLQGDILNPAVEGKLKERPFSFIIAHAILDLLPLKKVGGIIWDLLEPGGKLYSTINYDGRTDLVPVYSDISFEKKLLQEYDRSMDQRRASGLRCGGSRTGSLLHGKLVQQGFSILDFGASDWSVGPSRGAYRGKDGVFLTAIVNTMYLEGLKHAVLDERSMHAWHRRRMGNIDERNLFLISHQTDILAVK